MTAPSEVMALAPVAQSLGFEVHSGEGRVRGVLLCGEDVYFGGTHQECSAFLAGWRALRSRMWGTLGNSPNQLTVHGALPTCPTSLDPVVVRQPLPAPDQRAARCTNQEAPGQAALPALPLYSTTLSHVWTGQTHPPRRLFEPPLDPSPSRDRRQAMIAAWAEMAFGRDEATALAHRGLRLLEEAIETFQACGGNAEIAKDLVEHVFDHAPGAIGQELGGVAVAVLALAAAAGLSADEEECREVHRVLSRPVGEFTLRNAAKNAAGFKMASAGAL